MKHILTSVLLCLIFASFELQADFSLDDPAATQPPPLTLILAGGIVFAGDKEAGQVMDVGVLEDRIVELGDLSERQSILRIDVSGLAVTPGFIDIHSHAVRNKRETSGIFLWPDAENYIRQGVTTVIGGPDGGSEFPVAELLSDLEAAPAAVNFGTFVGHNTIRERVMGRSNRPPTAAELEEMKAMVEAAMLDGAFGLASGLKYIPGAYSTTEEVIELARVAGRYGGIYITHMREEGQGLIESVAETIRIGEEGGLPAQITHHKAMGAKMWGKSTETLALVDAANQRGLDVTSDQYPYTASSTGLRVLFPAWSMAGNKEERMARFSDPEQRALILEGIRDNLQFDRGGNDPSRVAIAECRWDPTLNGKNLSDILHERGRAIDMENAAALVLEMEESGGCSAVYHAMSDEDVVRIMQHPKTMVASDGGIFMPGDNVPHPRNYGSFARVLGVYVRERNVISFSEAVHKMSRMPADRLRLNKRGRIEPGAFADVTVLDPDEVSDRATFKNPHQFAIGVRHVFVNGQVVLLDGVMTGDRPGRVLKLNSKD